MGRLLNRWVPITVSVLIMDLTRFRLRQALTRWNAELVRGLTGKKKIAAQRKAKRQHLSPEDFDNLRRITGVMSVRAHSDPELNLLLIVQ